MKEEMKQMLCGSRDRAPHIWGEVGGKEGLLEEVVQ